MVLRIIRVALLLVLSTAVGYSQQRQHPPVDNQSGSDNPDFSKCVACHQDKASGSVVHAAVQVRCDTCHAVDQDEDWTEVFLIQEGNGLCFACHSDKQPAASDLTLHQPIRRDRCVSCHEPHATQTTSLLRKSPEGREVEQNLCLSCHRDILAQLQKPVTHAAVDAGCSICHTTHKSASPEAPEGAFHLSQAQPGLCLVCHDASDDSFQKAHAAQPVAASNCTLCHNPHGSDTPKLINNTIHAAMQMGCETCHGAPQDGKIVLHEGARRELCLGCHTDVETEATQAQVVHVPLKEKAGCVACHNPHATASPRLLKSGPVRTCLVCHSSLAEARANQNHLHKPAFQVGCTVCHQGHAGQRARLLRADTNNLCLECHNRDFPRALQVRIRSNVPMKLFDDTVEIPATLLDGLPTIPLQKGETKGHPSIGVGHPVAGKYPLGENMTCVTCHTPHAGVDQGLLATATEGKRLCEMCH